jgi:hypothetical protein
VYEEWVGCRAREWERDTRLYRKTEWSRMRNVEYIN